MPIDINSISFREDSIIWTELSLQENSVTINRAANDMLPILIHHKSINQDKTVSQISDFISDFIRKNELGSNNVKITIPGRFAIIKKILIDATIPKDRYKDMVTFEFEKSWDELSKNYSIYLPPYSRTRGPYKEILAVAIRNNVLNFYEKIFSNLNINLDSITPSCFTIDEFFRAQIPGLSGMSLLVGCQNRGYDFIISDSRNFLKYAFLPYSNNLDPIEKISSEDLVSNFKKFVDEIQKPAKLAEPLHDIQTIYLYGLHLNPDWKDLFNSKLQIPVKIFNFSNSSRFSITENSNKDAKGNLYQYIEPLSNIL